MAVFVSTNSPDSIKECCNLHSLPCKIKYNSEAQVDSYFHTSVREVENTESDLTASFRGRPLNGTVLKLPPSFSGYVLKENRRPFMEDEDRTVNVTKRFKQMTYWNLDRKASQNDVFQRAIDWIDIAKSVHSQIEDENSQRSVTGK